MLPSRSDDDRATRSEMAGSPNFFFASTSPTSPKDGRHEDVGRRAPSPAGRRSATIPADGTSSLEPAARPLPTVSSTSHRARPQFSPLRTDEVPHAISGRRRRHRLFGTTPAIALPRAAPVSSSSTLVAATQPRFCDLADTLSIGVVFLQLAAGRICDCRWGCGRGWAQSVRTPGDTHGTVLRF